MLYFLLIDCFLFQIHFVLLGVDLPFAVVGMLLEGGGDGAGELVHVDHEVFKLGKFGETGGDVDRFALKSNAWLFRRPNEHIAVVEVVEVEAEPFQIGEAPDFYRDGPREVVVVELKATKFLQLANFGADATFQLVEMDVQFFQVLQGVYLFRNTTMDEVVAEVEELKFGEVLDARGDPAVVLQLATIDIIVAEVETGDMAHQFPYLAPVDKYIFRTDGDTEPFRDGLVVLAPVGIVVPAFAIGGLVDSDKSLALGLIFAHLDFADFIMLNHFHQFLCCRLMDGFLLNFDDSMRVFYFDRFRHVGMRNSRPVLSSIALISALLEIALMFFMVFQNYVIFNWITDILIIRLSSYSFFYSQMLLP